MSEFQMAMIVSLRFWRGTSIVEGAYYYMDQARHWPQQREPLRNARG